MARCDGQVIRVDSGGRKIHYLHQEMACSSHLVQTIQRAEGQAFGGMVYVLSADNEWRWWQHMYTMSLQTLMANVEWTAYQSTVGAPISDGSYDASTGKRPLRPTTEEEAAAVRPSYLRHAREMEARAPKAFAAWREAYEAWAEGDLTTDMPRVEAYAEED